MYKTISNEIIRKFDTCYDSSKYIKDENEELSINDWVRKYRNVVNVNDIICLLLREDFLSEKDLILFAVWCARESLKLIENPDKRIVEACNVTERYANGEATKEELHTAHDAAKDATDYAYYAADFAIYDKANIAYVAVFAYSAAYYAAYAAYVASSSDSYAVSHYASLAASNADYAAYAYNIAACDDTRSAQLDKLLTYFK
jgi:hypothetical protein